MPSSRQLSREIKVDTSDIFGLSGQSPGREESIGVAGGWGRVT
jgi:hypothetical protein